MNNKKRITTPPTTGQMILGWLMAALYLTVLPGAVVSLLKFLELELSALWMNLICWGAGSVLVILALWDFLFKNLKLLRKQFWQAFQAVILGYLLYAFTQGILNFLYESIAPEFTNINNSSISAMVLEEPLAMAVALMVLVPIVEECIYRGMIFAPLANGKYIVGLLLSAVAFAFSHVASYVGTYPRALPWPGPSARPIPFGPALSSTPSSTAFPSPPFISALDQWAPNCAGFCNF